MYARHGSDAVPGEHKRPGAFKSQSNLRGNRSKCCWISEDLPLLTQMPISCHFSLHLPHTLSIFPFSSWLLSPKTNTSRWRIIQECFEKQIYSVLQSFSLQMCMCKPFFRLSLALAHSLILSRVRRMHLDLIDEVSGSDELDGWTFWVLSLRRKAKQNDNSWLKNRARWAAPQTFCLRLQSFSLRFKRKIMSRDDSFFNSLP